RGRIDWLSYKALDAVDGDPRVSQPAQRQEHLEMFVLLGDPALRLPTTGEVRLRLPKSATAGQKLKVAGELPEGMKARVEVSLERLPAGGPAGLAPLPRQPGEARDRVMKSNHEKANNFTLATKAVEASDGTFTAELPTPGDLSACIVRVRAVGKDRDAVAARRIELRKEPR